MKIKGINNGFVRIENANVYNLENAIRASGFPHVAEAGAAVANMGRAIKLGAAKPSSGHDCYLKGVLTVFDVTFPQYIWQQAKRYHWFDFVSSTSTMHCVLKMDVDKQCNPLVGRSARGVLKKAISIYNEFDFYAMKAFADVEEVVLDSKEDLFDYIVSQIPSGYMLTAQISTNYLQLKTIYSQRKNHKMREWRMFCEWVKDLPLLNEIIHGDKKKI